MADAPSYQASQYDAPSAQSLYNFWQPRVEGKNLGLSDEDLGVIRAQTVDQSTHNIAESRRLGQAGQLRTGGITRRGTQAVNQGADNSGLSYRSSALNDIAIQNAVMKHNDQYTAAGGLQSFLNNERANAFQIWQTEYYPWQTQQYVDMYSNLAKAQQSNNQWNSIASLAGTAAKAYAASQTGGGSEVAGAGGDAETANWMSDSYDWGE